MPLRRYFSSRMSWFALVVFALMILGSLYEMRATDELASRVIKWHTRPIGGGDMYPPWAATRAALHGIDPYSPAVTDQIETAIYGHPIPDSSPWAKQAFVYPAHIILLLAPLTLLPWHIVVSMLEIISFPVVAATAMVWLWICWSDADRKVKLMIVALALVSWPSISILGRQPTVFVSLAIACSVLLFRRSADFSAGVALALATVKPQLMILIMAWLMLLAIRERRIRFFAGFAVTMAILLAGSSFLVPHWVPQWLAAGTRYTGKIYPPLLISLAGRVAGMILSAALLLAALGRGWQWGLHSSNKTAFGTMAALLLAVTACLIPASPWMIYNELLLIPGVLVLISKPSGGGPFQVLNAIAKIAVVAAMAAAPLCGGLSLVFGFSYLLALAPSILVYLLPIPVTLALLAIKPPSRCETEADGIQTPVALRA